MTTINNFKLISRDTQQIRIAIAGMGPREIALVALLRLIGVPTEQGIALSLCYAAIVLGVALIGGGVQLVQGRVAGGALESEETDG